MKYVNRCIINCRRKGKFLLFIKIVRVKYLIIINEVNYKYVYVANMNK